MSMNKNWRHGILVLSTAVVVGVSLIVSLMFIARTLVVVDDRTRTQSAADLHELIDTIESTASIACFVKDQQLATEVARGLLKNRSVLGVRIESEGQELAKEERHPAEPPDFKAVGEATLKRVLYSPFDRAQQVGEIQLSPNIDETKRSVQRDARFVALLLVLQGGTLVIAIALVLLHWILRPIKGMSDALHSMNATAGDRLAIPHGHHDSELGQLAEDINSLADRLVASLDDERSLRMLREIDEKKDRAIFDAAESGIFIVNRGRDFESANPALLRQLGLPNDMPLSEIKTRVAALEWNDARQPWVARPYNAPPEPGNRASNSAGVVRRTLPGIHHSRSPERCRCCRVVRSHVSISSSEGRPASPPAGALTSQKRRSAPDAVASSRGRSCAQT